MHCNLHGQLDRRNLHWIRSRLTHYPPPPIPHVIHWPCAIGTDLKLYPLHTVRHNANQNSQTLPTANSSETLPAAHAQLHHTFTMVQCTHNHSYRVLQPQWAQEYITQTKHNLITVCQCYTNSSATHTPKYLSHILATPPHHLLLQ